jgi:hypothetical protein
MHATYLELGFEAGNDGGWDEPADAAAVDAQHRDQPLLRCLSADGVSARAIGIAAHGYLI